MALIVLQHNIADQYTVTVDYATAIKSGSLVGLDADGNIDLPSATQAPIGVAGDSVNTGAGGSVYSADLVIGAGGATRSTSNRVSDFFDETKASGFMTVYTGSGKFATTEYVAGSYTPGTSLYSDVAGKFMASSGAGLLALQVGYVSKDVSAVESGVPGVDVNSSMTLGDFLTVILSI